MLAKLFESQVNLTPENHAVKTPERFYTFRELDNYANYLASVTTDHINTPPGDFPPRIALLLPHGFHMIAAIIGVLKASKAYVPLSADYPVNRLAYMTQHSGTSLILTVNEYKQTAEKLAEKTNIPVITIDTEETGEHFQNPGLDISPQQLAYIMYTSGSTGTPKGVMQLHQNVHYYIQNWVNDFNITQHDRLTLLSSFCHDASIPDLWSALLTGACLYPLDIRNREGIGQLTQWLQQEQITVWHSVASLFAFFTNSMDQEPNTNRHLSSIRYIFLGGEPVRKYEIDAFNKHFPNAQLVNIYGQTESTLSSFRIFQPGETVEYFTIGQPPDQTEIIVLNDDDEEADLYETGEIVVVSPHLSPGYWNDPDTTEQVFIHDPELGPTYFTGDLGRLLPGNQIEFMGRRDFQVKLRGFRIELGDIESHLLIHPGVGEAIVSAIENDQEQKELCAYIVYANTNEKQDRPNPDTLSGFLANQLPDYMIPTHFVALEKFPLTQSGKIDRSALPKPETDTSQTDYTPPSTPIEKTLVDIWTGILFGHHEPGQGNNQNKIGINHNFFRLGGHSLTAVTMVSRIHRLLNAKLPVAQVFRTPTIKEIAQVIVQTAGHDQTFTSIPPAPEKEYYPMSSVQQRLFILNQLDQTHSGYHLTGFYFIDARIGPQQLKTAFDQFVQRHESFRTSFHTIDGQPVQRIHESTDFTLPILPPPPDLDKDSIETLYREFVRPFDLSAAPLLRAAVTEPVEEKRLLMIDVHHIVADGISFSILIKELPALYNKSGLPPLGIQYKDYSQWLSQPPQVLARSRAEKYWSTVFDQDTHGEIPVLNLPTDFPRPAVQRFEGKRRKFSLDAQLTTQLKDYALQYDSTLFILLLAVYNVFLSRLTGQEDIIAGTVVSGRDHEELQPLIGMFVNTLALRSTPQPHITFNQFQEQVKRTAVDAFDNQDFLFEDLVELVQAKRDISRNPIFDVTFRLQNFQMDASQSTPEPMEPTPGHLVLTPVAYDILASQFDFSLAGIEHNGQLVFVMEYSTNLFLDSTIDRFTRYFEQTARSALANPHAPLSQLQIIGDQEKIQILEAFNDSQMDFPHDRTVHDLIHEQTSRTPHLAAVTGMSRGREMTLSYRELYTRASILSAILKKQGATPGKLVAFMAQPAIEMIIGLTAILKTGAAYIPLDPGHPPARINYILSHSGAAALLTLGLNRETLAEINFNGPILQMEQTADTAPQSLDTADTPSHSPNSPAYVIYTSGSTGQPKGVVVEHLSAVNLIYGLQHRLPFKKGKSIIALTTISFDIFFLETIVPLTIGMKSIVANEDTRKDPVLLDRFIPRHKIDILQLTPSRLQMIVNFDKTLTALRSIDTMIVAGEAFPPALYKSVRDNFTGTVLNMYGPTETTIYASIKKLTELPPGSLPIGTPFPNTQLYIVDRFMRIQPIGVAGELLISGASLAEGYLNEPALTAGRFFATDLHRPPAQTDTDGFISKKEKESTTFINHQSSIINSLYRTGDLARWLGNGDVEYLGRLDFQVKVRGFRIELGEIESRLLECGFVEEAVVVAKGSDADRFLCAYVVTDGGLEPGVDLASHLRGFLGETLPDYMVPTFIVGLDVMPKTGSGKIDRKALPDVDGVERARYAAPMDELEETLVGIWASVLGKDASTIGTEDNFFHIGGHSLRATAVITKIHKELDVRVLLAELFRVPTIKRLADHIRGASRQVFAAVPVAKERDVYPLSPAQKRQYILHQVAPEGTNYNLPYCFKIDGPIDVAKLEEAFKEIIRRHDSLRTSFIVKDGEPVQRVHDRVEFSIERVEFIGDGKETVAPFISPFDLSCAPLLRVFYGSHPGGYDLMLVDMHHIITDGRSFAIFWHEVEAFYFSRSLDEPLLQYKDYTVWLDQPVNRERVAGQADYWKNVFSDDIPLLNLPIDYPRPVVQQFDGGIQSFSITAQEAGKLKELAKERKTTLFNVLLSIYSLFLSKITGQEDIVIGTPTANRRHHNLDSIIGMFVNTLALRTFPTGEETFTGFLDNVTRRGLESFENQEYPFEELVEALPISRDTGRNPLFDVMFGFTEKDETAAVTGDLPLVVYPYKREVARFDLTLLSFSTPHALGFHLQYSTVLFSPQTAERFTKYFTQALSQVAKDPRQQISQIELITEEEKKQILLDFAAADGPSYAETMNLSSFFDRQAAVTPDRIALVGVQSTGPNSSPGKRITQLTYNQLNAEANQLAKRLIKHGAQPGSIIALLAERCTEMLTGIWGILKAGCAYLPIDPAYPDTRISYMLQDSGVDKIVVTPGQETNTILSEPGTELTIIPVIPPQSEPVPEPAIAVEYHTDDIAYIIYTSGTTGKPKGTVTTHRNVLRVVKDTNYIDITPNDRVLQLSNYAFDGSVFDIYGAHLNGSALIMIGKDELLAIDQLSSKIETQHITIFFVTTALFNALVDLNIHAFKHIKKVLFGGERVSIAHTRRAFDLLGPNRILHVYGPTETTVYATYYPINHIPQNPLTIPIGRPLTHTRLLVLDKHHNPAPIGVYGELYIAGAGLAEGYLNRPALTSGCFLATDGHRPEAQTFTDGFVQKREEKTAGSNGPSFPMSYELRATSYLYRTGDLVRWLDTGDVEFLGRVDGQVKIRGFRVELGEVEAVLGGFDGVRDVVVRVVVDDVGDMQLCAYVVWEDFVGDPVGFDDLLEYVTGKLPEVMIPAYFVALDRIPLNASGKVDGRLLPKPDGPVGGDYVAPRDVLERLLAELWAEVLGIGVGGIGIDDNFFRLGGHSLKATVLISRVHKEFDVRIPLAKIFEAPRVRDMAEVIRTSAPERYFEIPVVGERGSYPLSPNQERLWFIHQREPESPGYNMNGEIELGGVVELNVIERVSSFLADRHESFRTVFRMVDHEPVQVILDHVDVPLEVVDVAGEEEKQAYFSFARRPFDLTAAPLCRLLFVRRGDGTGRLFYSMHHIISDGWSLEVFRREFLEAYRAFVDGEHVEMPGLPVRYVDFTIWNNERISEGGEANPSFVFWRDHLSGGVPVLDMPRLPGGEPEAVEGAAYYHMIDAELKKALEELAQDANTSLFVVMISFYLLVLRRYSSQEEVLTSVISAGRGHESLSPLIGFFVQSLLFKMDIDDNENFMQFLSRVHQRLMDVFKHQDYPLEPVFESLNTRYPQVPVSFNMMNVRSQTGEGEVEPFQPYHIEQAQDVKFDLEPYIAEYANGLTIWWSYRTSILDPTTVEHLATDYTRLIQYFTKNPTHTYTTFRQTQRKTKKKRTFSRNN